MLLNNGRTIPELSSLGGGGVVLASSTCATTPSTVIMTYIKAAPLTAVKKYMRQSPETMCGLCWVVLWEPTAADGDHERHFRGRCVTSVVVSATSHQAATGLLSWGP